MLLEFRVRNYRSFAEEAAFSLVASKDPHLRDENTAETKIKSLPRALRSAVVYGANASGKSNLMRALLLMRGVVLESANLKPDQPYNVQPFRLDAQTLLKPTMFEVTVLLGGVRHQYGFEFTPSRIISEWLLVYKTGRPQKWIDRHYDQDKEKETYDFSSFLSGPKSVWQEATRPNALFLSTAVQLNSEQLAPLFQWFSSALIVLLDGGLLPFEYSTQLVQSPEGSKSVVDLMQSADLAIRDISAVKRKGFRRGFRLDIQTGETASDQVEQEFYLPSFKHQAGDISAEFEYADESQGTQKLFSLAGPLFDIIKNGKVLVIDELDRSLHPLLVRQIVNTFHDPERNTAGAQLIFTTHDTSLLESGLLRRDQIWLIDKDQMQSSTLVPLTEFSPRKGEAIERGYLGGRYGGIPILPERLKAGSGGGEG
jgi:AAA15 family ATPase/GTPase